MSPRSHASIGIDVGGTFTDVVLGDERGRVHVAKIPTTPDDPLVGIELGVRQVLAVSDVAAENVARVVHGTTLSTNAILEHKGARTAFVATQGFGDMLELGREARVESDRYDLFYEKPKPPVDRSLTFEAGERIDAHGGVIRPLSEQHAREVALAVAAVRPEAVAICLLHAHANADHERRMADACRRALPDAYVVASSEVWPEIREYERALTTVMCAIVGPKMAAYLKGFERAIREIGIPAAVQIMESSGGVMTAARAARVPIYTVESGGAAGVVAAGFIGGLRGASEVISFDMGGTTAKAGIVRGGRPDVTHGFHVGGIASLAGRKGGQGFPVKIPVVDIAEVGSGGGSIAWVDAGGALRVGPRSAGADPGPACYDRGGDEPTVTDANLVLGYLNPHHLAGGVALSPERSAAAIECRIGKPLGIDVPSAARGIHDIANVNMAAAIRVVTVQRGIDPRRFSLIGFGGAGPMHLARLAEAFAIPSAVVPAAAGVTSALGLLASDLSVDRVRTANLDEANVDASEIEAIFSELEASGASELESHAEEPGTLEVTRSVDVQYRGQAHALTVGVAHGTLGATAAPSAAEISEVFKRRYRDDFGIDLDRPTQFVNFRARVTRVVEKLSIAPRPHTQKSEAAPTGERRAYFVERGRFAATPVYHRDALAPGQRIPGPAIIEGTDSTLVIPPTWTASIDAHGNALLERRNSRPAASP